MKLQLLSLSVCLCLSFSASIGARAEAGTAARVFDGAETRSAVSTDRFRDRCRSKDRVAVCVR